MSTLTLKRVALKAGFAFSVFLLVSPAILVFLWMLSLSLKNEVDNTAWPPVFIPNPPTLANYIEVFARNNFLLYLWNSILVTGGAVLVGLVLLAFPWAIFGARTARTGALAARSSFEAHVELLAHSAPLAVGARLHLHCLALARPVVLCALLARYQVALCATREPQQCFKAFMNNIAVGGIVFLGIMVDGWFRVTL
jgi:hypothetical protein